MVKGWRGAGASLPETAEHGEDACTRIVRCAFGSCSNSFEASLINLAGFAGVRIGIEFLPRVARPDTMTALR
jgi:hypothetical protein